MTYPGMKIYPLTPSGAPRRSRDADLPPRPRLLPDDQVKEHLAQAIVDNPEWLYDLVSRVRGFPIEFDWNKAAGFEYDFEEFLLTSTKREVRPGEAYWEHKLSFRLSLTFSAAYCRIDNSGPDWGAQGKIWIRNLTDEIDSLTCPAVFFGDDY